MTVNELIAELQALSAQGYGELDMCHEIYNDGFPELYPINKLELDSYLRRYKDKGNTPCIKAI